MACEATPLQDPDSLHFSYRVLPDMVLTITCIIDHGSYSCIVGLPASVMEPLQLLEMTTLGK